MAPLVPPDLFQETMEELSSVSRVRGGLFQTRVGLKKARDAVTVQQNQSSSRRQQRYGNSGGDPPPPVPTDAV